MVAVESIEIIHCASLVRIVIYGFKTAMHFQILERATRERRMRIRSMFFGD